MRKLGSGAAGDWRPYGMLSDARYDGPRSPIAAHPIRRTRQTGGHLRILEILTANIRNPSARESYFRAV